MPATINSTAAAATNNDNKAQISAQQRARKWSRLTESICSLLDDYSMVGFVPLNINDEDNSMILAGDIFENSKVQLMMTNVDNIVNAAEKAAYNASELRSNKTELAILVSCIGRKLVLDQRVEEEVEEVIEVIGDNTTFCGLYSYGEIAPFHGENNCQLHNQTMSVTLISE